MYLIDTSVWIDYLRLKKNPAVYLLKKILKNNINFGITGFIYQEILQGANSLSDFDELTEYFCVQQFYHPIDKAISFHHAAKLYFNCRRKGLTIRSSIDCYIAQIAIENELILLHNDNDFLHIQKVCPKLKLAALNTVELTN